MPLADRNKRLAYHKAYNRRARESEPSDVRAIRLEKTRQYHKQRYIDLRYAILKKYSKSELPSCACCRESFVGFLTIDHINGGGRKERDGVKGGNLQFYRYLLDKPHDSSEYQVLCYNCNCYKRNDLEKICPHQY